MGKALKPCFYFMKVEAPGIAFEWSLEEKNINRNNRMKQVWLSLFPKVV
ncbi:hypothetical protein [Marinilabilia rubra]|nr:hypothetical protein [Marinilabilia rubra]